MRIVSWNCNGAFRKKYEFIEQINADIHVIQECEDPSQTTHSGYKNWAKNFKWLGDNKNKGLGIFCSSKVLLQTLNWPNEFSDHPIPSHCVKYFLPIGVNDEFNLLGVWAHKNNSPNFGYMGQFWKYMQLNKRNFENDLIIAGDFNSNAMWDQWDRWWNHSNVISELEENNIYSVYHRVNGAEQGKEIEPTFFLQRNTSKPYHIDYFFASIHFLYKPSFNIGDKNIWLKHSDHLPLIFEF
jgi:endonuclease/exonuclease/phosphatase family metal-dependent hydrolase